MFYKKVLPILAGAALATTVACSENTMNNAMPTSELAAQAAATTLPSNLQGENSNNIGALIEPNSKTIRIFNFGSAPINNAVVWVNNDYVFKVDTLPPGAYVVLNESSFYDHAGHSLSDTNVTITKVQLQADDHLWTLLGPIVQ
jgi:hypothetical protein